MSYSQMDARIDFECRVQDVLNNRDVEGAYELAEALAEMGNEDEGDYFYQLARRWDDEDWAHDRNKDN